jgi:hypothetical protein
MEGELRRHWKGMAGFLGAAVGAVLLLNVVLALDILSPGEEDEVVRAASVIEGILILLTPVFFGVLHFSGDQSDGSAAQLASLPVPHRLIWTAKTVFAGAVTLLLVLAILGLFSLPFNLFVHEETRLPWKGPAPVFSLLLGAMVLLSIAAFTSMVIQRALPAALVVLAGTGLILLLPLSAYSVMTVNFISASGGPDPVSSGDARAYGLWLSSGFLAFFFLFPALCLFRRGRGLLTGTRSRILAAVTVFGAAGGFAAGVHLGLVNFLSYPTAGLLVPLLGFGLLLAAGWVLFWVGWPRPRRRMQTAGGALAASGFLFPLIVLGAGDLQTSGRLEQTFLASGAWVKPLEGESEQRPVFRPSPLDEDAGNHYWKASELANPHIGSIHPVVQKTLSTPFYQEVPPASRTRPLIRGEPLKQGSALEKVVAQVRERLNLGMHCRFLRRDTWLENRCRPPGKSISFSCVRFFTGLKWMDADALEAAGRTQEALTEHLEAAAFCIDLGRNATFMTGIIGVSQLKTGLGRLQAFLWRNRDDAELLARAGEGIVELERTLPTPGGSLRAGFRSEFMDFADMYSLSRGEMPRTQEADRPVGSKRSVLLSMFSVGTRRRLLDYALAYDGHATEIVSGAAQGDSETAWKPFARFLHRDARVHEFSQSGNPVRYMLSNMRGLLQLPVLLGLLRASHASLLFRLERGRLPAAVAELKASRPALDFADLYAKDWEPVLYRTVKTRKGEAVPVFYSRGTDSRDHGWQLTRYGTRDLALVPRYEFE